MDKIFDVHKNSRKLLIWIFIYIALFTALYAIYSLSQRKSFLRYSDKNYYVPVATDGKGFTGHVDAMLKAYLLDTEKNAFNIYELNKHYKNLKFSYPRDTASYLAAAEDIRLEDIIPKDKSDSVFLLNSYLKETLQQQRKLPKRQYFHLVIDRLHNFRIKSIIIDSMLYKTRLSGAGWRGTINYNEPFSKIDTQTVYIVFQDHFLPIFTDYQDTALYIDRRTFPVLWKNDKWIEQDSKKEISLVSGLLSYYQRLSVIPVPQPLKVILGDDPRTQGDPINVKIQNFYKNIQVCFEDVEKGRLIFAGGKKLPIVNHSIFRLLLSDLPVKATYMINGRPGSFLISRSSPLLVASRAGNTLAAESRVHQQPGYEDLFCRQFTQAIEQGLPEKGTPAVQTLSLNPVLSRYLEDELKDYLNEVISKVTPYRNDAWEISMCIADNKTGEILAAPFYSNTFRLNNETELKELKNFNLENHFIGSSFKPLLANASSVKFPELKKFHLNVDNRNTGTWPDTSSVILGYPVRPAKFGLYPDHKTLRAAFWTANSLGRTEFLAKSHDLYPIAMTMLAMTEPDDEAYAHLNDTTAALPDFSNLRKMNGGNSQRLSVTTGQHPTTRIREIENSSFIDLMSRLYDVEKSTLFDRDQQTWVSAYDTTFRNSPPYKTPEIALPEQVSLSADILGSDNLNNKGAREFSDYITWVLGQGLNTWNNVKLTEAYVRLFTMRDTRLTYWKKAATFQLWPDITKTIIFNDNRLHKTETQIRSSWRDFLTDFETAQLKLGNASLLGTASAHLRDAIPALRNAGIDAGSLVIIGKTGTPDGYERLEKKILNKKEQQLKFDEGLYVFGLMNKKDYNHINRAGGISGVIFIRHITLNPLAASGKPGYNGVNSKHARDFLSTERLVNIIFLTKNTFCQK
ncbi:MAG TPA: hypothetical protein VFE53_03220 [Mucilaginibacter sp.]|jgi:hypothetical protein|nr:hypothetical protein [Mucilaginibacter sp.]